MDPDEDRNGDGRWDAFDCQGLGANVIANGRIAEDGTYNAAAFPNIAQVIWNPPGLYSIVVDLSNTAEANKPQAPSDVVVLISVEAVDNGGGLAFLNWAYYEVPAASFRPAASPDTFVIDVQIRNITNLLANNAFSIVVLGP